MYQIVVVEGFIVFLLNLSPRGCWRAVGTQCEPVGSEYEPARSDSVTECEPGKGDVCKPACGYLRAATYSEMVFYVLTVVLSYSLYHLFANTQAGARFADRTRQALAFEQLRTQRTHIIVYARGYFDIFETLSFVQMVLHLSLPVQAHLRTWLAEHLPQIQKRE